MEQEEIDKLRQQNETLAAKVRRLEAQKDSGQAVKADQKGAGYSTSDSHPNPYDRKNARNIPYADLMVAQAYTMFAMAMTKMYDSMTKAYKQVEKTLRVMYDPNALQPAYAGAPGAAQRGNYQSKSQQKG
jgi:BMFP domain-containing protein YqiC